MAKKKPTIVLVLMIKGRPRVIVRDNPPDLHCWRSFEEAREWLGSDAGVQATVGATHAVAVDAGTGETEVLL